jgi:hypothetical protein
MTEAQSEHAPELSAQDARQARWGRPVLIMLVVSTLLAAVALMAAWAWRSGDLARVDTSPAQAKANAAQFHLANSASGPSSTPTPATAPTKPPE